MHSFDLHQLALCLLIVSTLGPLIQGLDGEAAISIEEKIVSAAGALLLLITAAKFLIQELISVVRLWQTLLHAIRNPVGARSTTSERKTKNQK
jgi:hypothetical protein